MENDEYYDIDSILAEHTKIPCIFLHDIDAEANVQGDDSIVSKSDLLKHITNRKGKIRANTRIELPYWMAKTLAQFTLPNGEKLLTVEIPKTYGKRVRNALAAGALNVDFRILCPYFYTFGTKLVELVRDEDLAPTLSEAFKTRLKEIMDYSQSGVNAVGQEFLHRLDETENECKYFFFWPKEMISFCFLHVVLKAGQHSSSQARQWRNRSLHQLKSTDIKARFTTHTLSSSSSQ
ncbi:DNA replication protein [Apophysomyces ossiformis]|uniref:DNA replication complex GINS protein PSF3 n=1 Tax=Apophysomyces ossiformis TaxID=679940 RepID=A0A8H7BPI4_9FUNG|nr:DNA replication protein [Apophysomyces ossiformis]